MADRFSLKDHLFNADTVGQLADEFAQALPGFGGADFAKSALSGFADRELLARLEWIATCLEPHLATDFPTMAEQLEAAMPPPLDPSLRDDDFGHFIHAVPGILAVRHGLEQHRDRALDLLHAATQRFSMESYIRPFLNRWPEETLARLRHWAHDPNYHVRRLVSEGTRPKLPWAKAVSLDVAQTLPLLTKLHGDPTRYVTRSVANHLNDISKSAPDLVVGTLQTWSELGLQSPKEMAWIRKHSLRGLIKAGHPGALGALGYVDAHGTQAEVTLLDHPVKIGDALDFDVRITGPNALPVMVDYRLGWTRANGEMRSKAFKLAATRLSPTGDLTLHKSHKLKADATTFTFYPGPARLEIQINGRILADVSFALQSDGA